MLGSFKVVIIEAACGSSLLAAHGPMHGHHEDKKIGGSRVSFSCSFFPWK
jgi:hypothetical protein